jgi:drug/metabolite transporter (DMT)-like permease
MIKATNNLQKILSRVPTSIYLAIAVLIFAASNSVTSKLIDIGKYHFIDGQNPISSCNVLFVGNLCALGLMFLIFHQDCKLTTLKVLTRKDWISLTITGILSGAIAPWLIFTALEQTNVTNIVLIGRIEPILSLIWGVWLLGTRVNLWTISGSLISFLGVVITALLASSGQMMTMAGFQIGIGEFFVAIAAIFMAYLILGEIPSTAQYLGGSFLLVGVILSFIGNLYQTKINRELIKPNPREAMEMPMGFRGV